MNRCAEKNAHDIFYAEENALLNSASQASLYTVWYDRIYLSPFHQGGITKGYVRGLSVKALITSAEHDNKSFGEITVLDAGCGQGGLAVYLACIGFHVVAVDLSTVACNDGKKLAEKMMVTEKCRFFDTSLVSIPIEDASIDYIIGHASLHHFIKYQDIVSEFSRVTKNKCEGFFADSYGENKLYHLFHNKEQMKRLGDVSLVKEMVEDYFSPEFEVKMVPTDWFSMLDKLWLKILPRTLRPMIQGMAKIHYALDRSLSTESRMALRCAGSAMTHIRKKN